jgi:hypothetical protein
MVDFKKETRHYCRNTSPAIPSCPPISTGRRKKASGRGLMALVFVFVIVVWFLGSNKATHVITSRWERA